MERDPPEMEPNELQELVGPTLEEVSEMLANVCS